MLHADLFRVGWHRLVDTFRIIDLSVQGVTDTSITVRWTMSEVCSGQLEYGVTTSYGSTTTESPIGDGYFQHLQTITGLSPGTTYHFRTKSTSASAITVYSDDQSRTTSGGVVVTTRGPRSAPPVPTGSNVYTISGSIPNNGTGDVGGAITSWLNGLPSGSIAVFTSTDTQGYIHGVDSPVATFRLTSNGIQVPAGITLWGYGCKIQLETYGNSWEHAAFSHFPSGHVTVCGFEIAGVNFQAGTTTAHDVGRQHGTGFSVAGSSGADISADMYDTWVHHVWSDAFLVAGWGDVDSSPSGFDIAYNLFELTGRYGIVLDQNDSGTAWIHHNVIKDTGLYLIGGEDQRLGTDDLRNVLVEENDLGTWSWHYTETGWLPRAIAWLYDYWSPLPNIDDCGPITIRNNTFIGGAAPATFAFFPNHIIIDEKDVYSSASDYHDLTISGNDFSGIPAAQKASLYWFRAHNFRNVTATDNTNLGAMAARYTTTGSSGVTVSGNT